MAEFNRIFIPTLKDTVCVYLPTAKLFVGSKSAFTELLHYGWKAELPKMWHIPQEPQLRENKATFCFLVSTHTVNKYPFHSLSWYIFLLMFVPFVGVLLFKTGLHVQCWGVSCVSEHRRLWGALQRTRVHYLRFIVGTSYSDPGHEFNVQESTI